MGLLFLGYQLFADDVTPSNEQVSTAPQGNQTDYSFILEDADESNEQELRRGSNHNNLDENKDERKDEENHGTENISDETGDKLTPYTPSQQDIAELDIPVRLELPTIIDAEPEINIYDLVEGRTVVACCMVSYRRHSYNGIRMDI